MNYCNCPNCQTVNCPAALDEAQSGASVRSSELVRRQLADHPYVSPLERAAIEQALNAGEQFGYGNEKLRHGGENQ